MSQKPKNPPAFPTGVLFEHPDGFWRNADNKNPGMTNRLILDMPAAEYHAHPAISASGLKLIARSPAHYRYARDHEKADTAALAVGKAFHTLVLEPHLFPKEVAIWDKTPRNANAGKAKWAEFTAEHAGKTIIDCDDHKRIVGMAKAISEHPLARGLLKGEGHAEASLFWTDEETGVECRCRYDWLRPLYPVDLKTTTDASPSRFAHDIHKYAYHMSAAFYFEGHRVVTGELPEAMALIAVEKEPPHGVTVHVITAGDLADDLGHHEFRKHLRTYAECARTNTWPSYPVEPLPYTPPQWAINRMQNEESYA